MPSLRQLKLNELIKRQLGQMLLKNSNLPSDVLVSVLEVEVSSDLQWADAILQVYPAHKGRQVLQILQDEIYDLQQELNQRVDIRHTPKLRFKLETKLH